MTVLMSVYDEKLLYLKQAVESILNQTYHKLEIIWLLYFVYDADWNYGTGVFIRHIIQENI